MTVCVVIVLKHYKLRIEALKKYTEFKDALLSNNLSNKVFICSDNGTGNGCLIVNMSLIEFNNVFLNHIFPKFESEIMTHRVIEDYTYEESGVNSNILGLIFEDYDEHTDIPLSPSNMISSIKNFISETYGEIGAKLLPDDGNSITFEIYGLVLKIYLDLGMRIICTIDNKAEMKYLI